ncbi:Uncharacterised protein [Mobiluncus curtisii]|uniref:Uncharacterized protein n=2 Tax=Mobiluncus curtisii TaxID=2051 RepID=A0A2X3BQF8_9ACTO|nr:Uncharacterised protein [Mobiluncus curtisii]
MNKLTKGLGIVAAVGLALAGLAGCAPEKPLAATLQTAQAHQTVDQPKLSEYYSQDLQWKNCGRRLPVRHVGSAPRLCKPPGRTRQNRDETP